MCHATRYVSNYWCRRFNGSVDVLWSRSIRLSGFWQLPLLPNYKPPPPLLQFLESSQPSDTLVYIGFGSIQVSPLLLRQLISILNDYSCRIVLVTSLHIALNSENPIYILENIPHSWLFPQMDLLIHHGGAGTTACALKSGKPSLIIPFFGDQYFWARTVHQLQCGLFVHQKQGRIQDVGACRSTLAMLLNHLSEYQTVAANLQSKLNESDDRVLRETLHDFQLLPQ